MTRLFRWAKELLRFLLGVVLTQLLPGAWLLSGWGQEVMRRAVRARWAKAAGTEPPAECAAWPAFIVSDDPDARGLWRFAGGAGRNLLRGVNVLAVTYAVTLPGVSLMAFSWRYGWDNSFNKGYEQAYIGPALGVSGLFLFMLSMLYVPMAQAQLAIDGRRAAFFHWRIVWAALRCRLRGALLLAAAYFAASLPIQLFFVAVLFRFNAAAAADLSDAELRKALEDHFFLAGMVGLPLFAWVRLRAARTYAEGVLSALRAGRIAPEHAATIPAVAALRESIATPAPSRIGTVLRRTTLAPALALLLVLWFGFGAQIYIKQFLNYVPLSGWLNQPLVHTPWLRYIPPHLDSGGGADEVDLPPY